jgi:hypothetical protein
MLVSQILDALRFICDSTREQIAAIRRTIEDVNAVSGSQKGNLIPCPSTTRITSLVVVNGLPIYGLVEIPIDEFFKIIELWRIISIMDDFDESSRQKMMELVKMKLEGEETTSEAQGMISLCALRRLQTRGNTFLNHLLSRVIAHLFISPDDEDSYW